MEIIINPAMNQTWSLQYAFKIFKSYLYTVIGKLCSQKKVLRLNKLQLFDTRLGQIGSESIPNERDRTNSWSCFFHSELLSACTFFDYPFLLVGPIFTPYSTPPVLELWPQLELRTGTSALCLVTCGRQHWIPQCNNMTVIICPLPWL